MSIQDFRTLSPGLSIETDLCLVGSGFAGWTIAEELRDSGLRILILESGGTEPESDTDALNEIESVGIPLFNGRSRVLGGTSHLWTGKCIPFAEIDYEARPWVPLSGWPFGHETIAPYLDRASEHLGAGPYGPDGTRPNPISFTERPDVDPALLVSTWWQYSQGAAKQKPVQFGPNFLARGSTNLRVLVHATVTHQNTDASGAILESVEIADPKGKRATVRARAVVLCAGGVENARILLYSNRTMPRGIGNGYGVVGRFLMDHPHTADCIVRFDPCDRARVCAHFGPYKADGARGRHKFIEGLALSPEVQRRDGLLNCAALYEEFMAADDPIEAAKRLCKGPRGDAVSDLGLIVSQPRFVLGALYARSRNRAVIRRVDQIGLFASVEQIPDRDSRIRLTERRDRLGLPIPEMDWRIGRQERASLAALGQHIASEFKRLGLLRVHLADWVRDGRHEDAAINDSCHPSGTTRMASNPRYGVVNANCQVHGVARLYAAGSSVFPTVGHANPTLMIVALAIRLAHHLRERLSADASVAIAAKRVEPPSKSAEQGAEIPIPKVGLSRINSLSWGSLSYPFEDTVVSSPTLRPGTVAAVTGATGFIGGRLVERLAEQGVVVTALLRRAAPSAHLERTGTKTIELDLADSEAAHAALKGIDVVFHCAYDWDSEAWNLAAVRALITSCRANGIRRLVHLSSFVVYQTPVEGEVTEESPEDRSDAGYAFMKRRLEREILSAVREESFPGTILQPTLVYGPYSRPFTIDPADMLRYGTVVLPDRGEGLCNAVYIDDVVSAMIAAADQPRAVGERFLISGPGRTTWGQFYEEIARTVGANRPHYRPVDEIEREGSQVRKLRRLVADPARVVRRVAQSGPGRKLVNAGLGPLPPVVRRRVNGWLFRPRTCWRGQVHVPNAGQLYFLQSRATIGFDKARRILGYAPQFDFLTGMVPTGRFLKDIYLQGAERASLVEMNIVRQ
jgi:nucleoside-diphosphate-sugar epimerase/choline dehydrogenase-like flavoprotein